jgi:hypothetical protein
MQATVKYPRLAAVIAAIEKTGRTRTQIGHLAGRDGSAASRWAKGTHLPGWSAVRSLSDAVRGDSPELADQLLKAWHYYSDPVERGPDSTIPPEVLRVIRRNYSPERQRKAIEALEAIDRERRGEELPPSEQHAG